MSLYCFLVSASNWLSIPSLLAFSLLPLSLSFCVCFLLCTGRLVGAAMARQNVSRLLVGMLVGGVQLVLVVDSVRNRTGYRNRDPAMLVSPLQGGGLFCDLPVGYYAVGGRGRCQREHAAEAAAKAAGSGGIKGEPGIGTRQDRTGKKRREAADKQTSGGEGRSSETSVNGSTDPDSTSAYAQWCADTPCEVARPRGATTRNLKGGIRLCGG